MPQLDRFLALLVSRKAAALLLAEGQVATVSTGEATRAVTSQALSGAQIVAVAREIAPPGALREIESGGNARFDYASAEGSFDVMLEQGAGKVSLRIEPKGPAALERMEGLLRTLVSHKASDLHLRVGSPPMLRKSGEIENVEGEPAVSEADIASMLNAVMHERNRTEFAATNDTDFAYEIAGVGRYRGNAFRERKGTGAVFRAIPATVVTVEDMGLSPEVQKLCYLTKGLVLVTGPTGSGKSTTLCALIDLINRTRSDHIITIEDPIEFVHESKKCLITQRHVGVHTSSFKHALRAALREDPDIVLVGELRDLETVSMAIETAETGHLVFGTVHTSSAVSTVDRVIDQFPPDRQTQIRVMLSESLKGVISQVLCRKIGGGRVAAREIMLGAPSISNLIREGKTFQLASVLQTSRKLGMVTLNDALMELVESNQVEPKEAYMKATDKVGILNLLKTRGKDVSFATALQA
jgi:twitching motility protein PilT